MHSEGTNICGTYIIDSRLEKSGKPAYDTQEAREKEIEECYPELSSDLRKSASVFFGNWNSLTLNKSLQ